MTLSVKMEEHVLDRILVTVLKDIPETYVKMVFSSIFAPSTCLCILHYTLLAMCDPFCKNGGTCAAPDTCECLRGYSGDLCENCVF